MARRIHTNRLFVGAIPLDESETHHARDVLRLAAGTSVEIFDDAGHCAQGILIELGASKLGASKLGVRVDHFDAPKNASLALVVASAVPKGDRADWMIEKLSELGADTFIPLISTRSVVVPSGKNKLERWKRIAIESAKQSRRIGVMRIETPMPLLEAIQSAQGGGWFFSTDPAAATISAAIHHRKHELTGEPRQSLTLFIGPEGGWTDGEIEQFRQSGLTPVSLGATILRIETAALAAVAVTRALTHRTNR